MLKAHATIPCPFLLLVCCEYNLTHGVKYDERGENENENENGEGGGGEGKGEESERKLTGSTVCVGERVCVREGESHPEVRTGGPPGVNKDGREDNLFNPTTRERRIFNPFQF